jgi:hypothetical protein
MNKKRGRLFGPVIEFNEKKQQAIHRKTQMVRSVVNTRIRFSNHSESFYEQG